MNEKKFGIILAHGGVGDFLWQLDLAKRLEDAGITPLFLIRKNYSFLSDISQESNIFHARLMRADGYRYIGAILYCWFLSVFSKVVLVNSFHFTHLRLPTKVFYRGLKLCGAKVFVSTKEFVPDLPYEQLVYGKDEMIWQRNIRIVEQVSGKKGQDTFPILNFKSTASPFKNGSYIHIHPVASVLSKSYPPADLAIVLRTLGKDLPILLTMTPDADAWYMTPELRSIIESQKNITFISKKFALKEIAGLIAGASKFVTVNTGLLWLAIMLGQKVVVCDTDTLYEWNPSSYEGVLRLYRPEAEEVSLALANV